MHGHLNVRCIEQYSKYSTIVMTLVTGHSPTQHFIYCFERFNARKLCTACSSKSYQTVPFINLNKYLHNDTRETEENVNIIVNNGSEKLKKKLPL